MEFAKAGEPKNEPAHREGRLYADRHDAGPLAAMRLLHGAADTREDVAQQNPIPRTSPVQG